MMTLPFALLVELLPAGAHGVGAGLFGVSRGFGLLAGPVVAGLAITLLDGTFADTEGYAAVFLVAAAFLAASIPMLWRLSATAAPRPASDRDDRRTPAPHPPPPGPPDPAPAGR